MIFREVKGNLLDMTDDGQFDLIIHCCNCFHTMGSGIAKAIKERYPDAYAADLATVKGDKSKLGTFSHACIDLPQASFAICNLYGQFTFGRDKVHIDYEAIRQGLSAINNHFKGKLRVGTYQLGCHRAGGDWAMVRQIMEDTMPDKQITIVI